MVDRREEMTAEAMAGLKRTHGCGALTLKNAGDEVVLMGWVVSTRDHGGVLFCDLRDRSGVVQTVFNPDVSAEAFHKASLLRGEDVVAVRGKVVARPKGFENPDLPTGDIEVRASELRILNPSRTPPFYIEDGIDVEEALRLRYRYLDLRRPEMQRAMEVRHRAAKAVRDFFSGEGFLEIETPFLTRSTPEGARDYLVPSRVSRGRFFALPQSPQLFKQLLMTAGVERYFQIARCFRDEDLRAHRQPEFTQIDVEMSFVDSEDVMEMTEEMMARLYSEVPGVDLDTPFPRLTYSEAMERYGTDKPDLRFGLELQDVTEEAAGCGFKVFERAAQNGAVKGLRVPGGADAGRGEIDELSAVAAAHGAAGLAWIARTGGGFRSPVAKHFSEGSLEVIAERLSAGDGDLMLFVAGPRATANAALDAVRREVGRRHDLIDEGALRFVWIVEFPVFEPSEEGTGLNPTHHPFTAPVDEDLPLLDKDPLEVRARAYDLVLNGVELGGGSIRIHRRELQEKMLGLLGFSKVEAARRFGFLLDALEYGCPPHGGIALGFDRICMMLAGRDNIRDVVAFPKTARAACLMTGAPAPASEEQLEELGIRVVDDAEGEAPTD